MKLFMFSFLLSRVCPNLLLSSFQRYALPVNSFLQLGLTLRPFLLILEHLTLILVFLRYRIRETHNLQGLTPSRVKRRCPLEPLEGSPALTNKDIHSECNICQGESKRHWRESRPQRQHLRRLQEFFLHFTEISMGLKIIINEDQTTQLRVNFQIG